MKITKYGHACMFLEQGGRRLVVDPGVMTQLPDDLSNIDAVIVTHVHADHLSADNIAAIIAANPNAVIAANGEVMKEIADANGEKIEVTENCTKTFGDFEVEFMTGDHAVTYQKSPCQNLRIVVNGKLYFPGDSLVPHGSKVQAVAVPLSAPWSKVSEVIEFTAAVEADVLFPVHDGILNEMGQGFYNTNVAASLEGSGKAYRVLRINESIDL